MKNPISLLLPSAVAGLALAALTASTSALAVETTCTGSSGTNCPAMIPDGNQPGIDSTLTVPANICGGQPVTAVRVRVDLTHSWVGDLTVAVKNPANATAVLIDQLGGAPAISCQGDDLVATFQDGGATPSCVTTAVPSVGGTLAPSGTLAGLAASATGLWTLTVTDHMHGNNGLINDWAVDVTCGVPGPADVSVALAGFPASAPPNSTANGTVKAARTQIAMVDVGGLVLCDVDALVLPDEALSENLLGLSFLSRLKRFEYANGTMVLEQ